MNKYLLVNTSKLVKIFFIICCFLGQTGCAYYPNDQTKTIREANIQHMTHCTLLGQVYGYSHFAFLAMGVEMAKDKAKAEAAEIGATHVVWTEVSSTGLPYALGRAYYCKPKR